MSKEAAKAQGFFGELFNWKTQNMPMPGGGGSYTMIALGNETIGGYMTPPEGAPPHAHWLAHLQVSDAAASAKLVKSLGGKIRKDATKMGDFGTFAIVADPLDGTFALWQPGKPEGTGDFRETVGTFCWNELMTEDPDKSVAFYSKVGGFTVNKMDMGPMGTYNILEHDGKGRAGIMKSPMPGIPQSWIPYVHVASTDQTVEKAKKLGASIKAPPADIPEVGRFAVFTDPQGAAIGILQPKR
ncbi:MAG TPA: VOC family protein [Kofleriaceae bacterium]|nr:VOC family protein [Kofleriaceae bacterium]